MKNATTLLSSSFALIIAAMLTAQVAHAGPDSQSELNEFRARQIQDETARNDSLIAQRNRANFLRANEGRQIADRGYAIAKTGTQTEIDAFREAHRGDSRLNGSGVWDALKDRSRALKSPVAKGARKIPVVKAVAAGLGAYGVISSNAATVDSTTADGALRATGTDLKNPEVTEAQDEPATFTRSKSQTAR